MNRYISAFVILSFCILTPIFVFSYSEYLNTNKPVDRTRVTAKVDLFNDLHMLVSNCMVSTWEYSKSLRNEALTYDQARSEKTQTSRIEENYSTYYNFCKNFETAYSAHTGLPTSDNFTAVETLFQIVYSQLNGKDEDELVATVISTMELLNTYHTELVEKESKIAAEKSTYTKEKIALDNQIFEPIFRLVLFLISSALIAYFIGGISWIKKKYSTKNVDLDKCEELPPKLNLIEVFIKTKEFVHANLNSYFLTTIYGCLPAIVIIIIFLSLFDLSGSGFSTENILKLFLILTISYPLQFFPTLIALYQKLSTGRIKISFVVVKTFLVWPRFLLAHFVLTVVYQLQFRFALPFFIKNYVEWQHALSGFYINDSLNIRNALSKSHDIVSGRWLINLAYLILMVLLRLVILGIFGFLSFFSPTYLFGCIFLAAFMVSTYSNVFESLWYLTLYRTRNVVKLENTSKISWKKITLIALSIIYALCVNLNIFLSK